MKIRKLLGGLTSLALSLSAVTGLGAAVSMASIIMAESVAFFPVV